MTTDARSRRLTVHVRIGSEYFAKRFLFIRGSHAPQTVVWVEDGKGAFVDTIFMTQSGAKGAWGDGEIERPSCFPVWSHDRGIETLPGYFMPTKENPLPDAVTGATPKSDFDISWPVPAGMKPGVYRVLLEVNSSYDYNQTFSNKSASDVYYHPYNGQPSIVWANTIEIDGESRRSELTIVGRGSTGGDVGTVYQDLTDITTARNLVDSITVDYIP